MIVLVAAVCGATEASAFVLERSISGAAVHWPHTCVGWWMAGGGCPDVTAEETRDVLVASFGTWDAAEDMYVDFEEAGVTCADTVGLDGIVPLNVAMWRGGVGGWPYTERVVGLTTLTFDTETGEIVDADMEFNSEDYTFSVDEESDTYDLQQAVTHEVGHVLGLGHSAVSESVMYATAGPGAVDKRVLTQDDFDGVAANHGLIGAPPAESCGVNAPKGTPDAPHCPPPPPDGCGASRPGHGSGLAWLVLLALWTLMRGRRRWALVVLSACVVTTAWLPSGAARARSTPKECNPFTVTGGPIYWPVDRVELWIDPDLPEAITAAQMLEATHTGLGAWADLACVEMAVDVRDEGGGFADCPGEVKDDGIQCVYWTLPGADWPWGSALIAVTLVHHNTQTAQIFDTDMAINGVGPFTWSAPEVCDPDSASHDLLATLTHEFGHFFGLDHSDFAQSVMEGATRPGDCDKRTPEAFDVDCLCDTLATVPGPVEPTPDAVGSGDAGDGSAADPGPIVADSPGLPPRRGCTGCRTGDSRPLALLSLLSLAHLAMRRRRRGPRAAPAR